MSRKEESTAAPATERLFNSDDTTSLIMAADLLTMAALLVSLAALAKASEYAIIYASAIARLAGISELAIGFLLVAVATSLPELVVSVTSALSGNMPQLGIGNVFGANIADVTLVLGAAAVAAGLAIPRKQHVQLARILVAVSSISLVMVLSKLSRLLGVTLLLCFGAYVYFVMKQQIKFEDGEKKKANNARQGIVQQVVRVFASSVSELFKSLAFFSASILMVIIASRFAVDAAVNFATSAGVGLAVVGSTLVSLGTTLPELSVSVAAARANKGGLALGNAIGSCITNITLIMGLAIIINPQAADLAPHLGLIAYSILAYFILLFFLEYGKKIGKLEGAILLLTYLVFLLAQANLILL